MNQYDIEDAVEKWRDHPTLGPATRTLMALVRAVNSCSDGWSYWQPPSRAARKLCDLVEGIEVGPDGRAYYAHLDDRERKDATPEKVRKALAPIKAFRTKWLTGEHWGGKGVDFEIEEPGNGPPPLDAYGRLVADVEHIKAMRASLDKFGEALAVVVLAPAVRTFLEQRAPKALQEARAAFGMPKQTIPAHEHTLGRSVEI